MFVLSEFNPKKNLFIEASAGTGKTHTVKLIVSKMICGDEKNGVAPCSLDNILIVTFTEKAAGELKDRIRKQLEDILKNRKIENKPDEAELSEEKLLLCKEQIEKVDTAPIFTIHSFCQRTLEEFAFIAKQPYELGLIDEGEVKSVIEKWIRDVAAKKEDFKQLFFDAGDKQSFLTSLESDLRAAVSKYYLDDNGLEVKEIVSLDEKFKTGSVSIDYSKVKDIHNAKHFEDLSVIDGFESYRKTLVNGSDKAKSFVQNMKENFEQYFNINFDGRSYQQRYFHDENEIEAFDFFKSLKDNFAGGFSKLYENAFKRESLKEIYQSFQEYKKQKKMQSYKDMIHFVRDNICLENSNLRKELQKKYKYAIIDEFQDTNKTQWDIFSSIFMEDTDHSIIVVGDPKQSIFSFQGSDVTVYRKAIEQMQAKGARSCVLDRNFRSTQDMVKACNALFSAKSRKRLEHFFWRNNLDFADSNFQPNWVEPPLFDGEKLKPFLFYQDQKDTGQSEWRIAEKIIDCCSPSEENPSKTRLQIYDREIRNYRNATFKDFAILVKTGSEYADMEYALIDYGIPFSRYKDKNLFNGSECSSWISLLAAIEAPDFAGARRTILSEALYTIFLNNSSSNYDYIQVLEDSRFDDPTCKERQFIVKWQQLAKSREWAKLLEAIFMDTQIEQKLSTYDGILKLAKIRQIGNYIVDYLYSNACSLNSAKKHLVHLYNSKASEDDGSLVEKGTDFDCVQIMTIYAAKGLDSQIVISLAGKKNMISIAKRPGVAVYHDDETKLSKISFDQRLVQSKQVEEEYAEWERVFYVAYTRAVSWMIIPFYEGKKGPPAELQFLFAARDNFMENPDNAIFYDSITINQEERRHLLEYKSLVPAALKLMREGEEKNKSSVTQEEQLENMAALIKEMPGKRVYTHSYSSLSNQERYIQNEIFTDNEKRIDKDGSVNKSKTISLKGFDLNGKQIFCDYQENNQPVLSVAYPKGTEVGIATHEIFEKLDFAKTGNMNSYECIYEDAGLNSLMRNSFFNQSLEIDEKDSKGWIKQTSYYVWNTLNADFPEIIGNKATDKKFNLKSLKKSDYSAEVDFSLNPEESELLRNYCNGFIDLVFRREVDGKTIYSLVDWKSDSLEDKALTDAAELKNKVDDDYSIQRVLYSYCLIKWLKQFYGEKEEQIFEKYFGGMYYVLFRGCLKGTGNGIYAHTWNSWNDLEKAFNHIKHKLMKVWE